MTYTAVSVIGMDTCVVEERIVRQCRLECCRMAVTIYRRLTKLSPPIGQHHHLMIVSTIARMIQWLGLIPGMNKKHGVK